MRKIKVLDKDFKIFISEATIKRAIDNIAMQINNDYSDKEILFISILNGAFMFSADLLKQIKVKCKISFVKLSSYSGSSTTGNVKEIIGLSEDIQDQHVIILEDIIDTGITIKSIVNQIKDKNPASLKVAALLFKPQAYQENLPVNYSGIDIANEFIIGYGLDYNGYGRNYANIYALASQNDV